MTRAWRGSPNPHELKWLDEPVPSAVSHIEDRWFSGRTHKPTTCYGRGRRWRAVWPGTGGRRRSQSFTSGLDAGFCAAVMQSAVGRERDPSRVVRTAPGPSDGSRLLSMLRNAYR